MTTSPSLASCRPRANEAAVLLERALADFASTQALRAFNSVVWFQSGRGRTVEAGDGQLGGLQRLNMREPAIQMRVLVVLEQTDDLYAACNDQCYTL